MTDYARVEQAICFLEAHFREQPLLSDVAADIGLSEYHFQRLFRRWAGISPKRFLQFLTADYARELLEQSQSALEVAYETGLSSPSRLHDLAISIYAMTPGELKRHGAPLLIRYGMHPSPFGYCFIATTDRGVCGLAFQQPSEKHKAVYELEQRWPGATVQENARVTAPMVKRIFGGTRNNGSAPLLLFVKGTNFQVKVWEALLRIPAGSVASYQDVATMSGAPTAARAVGTAVGHNPIAYLIPCHRVIRKSGAFGEYRWGPARKKAMLGWEAAQAHLRGQALSA